MIEEKEFDAHLLTINAKSWERLFELLPQIEKEKKFGELTEGKKLNDGALQMPYMLNSKIVNNFLDVFYELNLCVAFDWPSWTEGKEILNKNDFAFNILDTLSLCKLLTAIVRNDRFNEGFLISCFQNGTIPKIIKAIKQNETKEGGDILEN